VYDVGANAGWVSVGITSDTAQFAVASIRTAGSTRWGASAKERKTADQLSEMIVSAMGIGAGVAPGIGGDIVDRIGRYLRGINQNIF
jgi:hypothetical protein